MVIDNTLTGFQDVSGMLYRRYVVLALYISWQLGPGRHKCCAVGHGKDRADRIREAVRRQEERNMLVLQYFM